jgi:hypothetical protein
MGILDRIRAGLGVQRPVVDSGQASVDDQAIARYRYMLKTAPPETIEQAHAEAFAQLTPEQRRRVLQELSSGMSPGERMAAARAGDDPRLLAQLATRAEIRQPGTMERALGGVGGMAGSVGQPGMGSMFAGSLLSSMAGTVIGSLIAQQFFTHHAGANQLFGNDALAGDSSLHGAGATSHGGGVQPDDTTAGLIHDPFADAGNVDSTYDGGDFDAGGGFDSGGFDSGGDSFDV